MRCLLSAQDTRVDLTGYCDFDTMLQYRLDQDIAFVLVSAISEPESVMNRYAPLCRLPFDKTNMSHG